MAHVQIIAEKVLAKPGLFAYIIAYIIVIVLSVIAVFYFIIITTHYIDFILYIHFIHY